jgi:hypothetical protein
MVLGAAIFFGSLSAHPLSAPPAEAHSLGRSASEYCRTGITGRAGIAVKKSKAKTRARRKWAYDAKRAYGYDFSGWQYAESGTKHYHCEKKAGTWRCSAVGRPCSWQAR